MSPARTSRQRQTRRPRLLFSCGAKWLHQDSAVISSDQQWQQQQEAAAGKPQASRRQAAGKQQASSRGQAAGKQQASSKPSSSNQAAATKQQQPSSSNQCMALGTKTKLFPGARPQSNEIIQSLKVVLIPKSNFFHTHGLPIRL